jgi:phosphatidylcholine synthase
MAVGHSRVSARRRRLRQLKPAIKETAPCKFDKAERYKVKPTPRAVLRRRKDDGQGMSIEKRPVGVASAAGFSVHLFTASGGAVAVLALYAAIERNFAICFAWLGLALFIDGIDGTLARAAKVQITAATIDGTVLDLVIDFLTYVLVPVIALWRSDLMPTEASFWIGLVVTIASALYFADTRMKTDDLWFRGFPATWNIVVLYLFVLRPPWVISALVLLGAAALMFTPVVFIHPLRVVRLRGLTIAMTCAWFGFAAIAIAENLAPQAWVGWGLIATAIYFLGLPFLRHSPLAHD